MFSIIFIVSKNINIGQYIQNTMVDNQVDLRNIELVKTLFRLKEDLYVYEIISANSEKINNLGAGKSYFAYARQSALESIVLQTCKIYEQEKKNKKGEVLYDLNSIDGVMRMIMDSQYEVKYKNIVDDFIGKYSETPNDLDYKSCLSEIICKFMEDFSDSIGRFKTYRDKFVAHSESDAEQNNLPSFDIMKKLFDFSYDFYQTISDGLLGIGPVDLNTGSRVKVALKHILDKHGLKEIKDNLE